jgi:cytochrome c
MKMTKIPDLIHIAVLSAMAFIFPVRDSGTQPGLYATNEFQFFQERQNDPPTVTLVSPENNSTHDLKSLVRYSINVSDKEDGELKYDEIPLSRIFLEVKFVKGKMPSPVNRKQFLNNEPMGLQLIKDSDCFSCHAFRNRLIGPSFDEISHRYPNTPANRKTLEGRIREGSTGVWGELVMPTHALSAEASESIVEWVLKNGRDPGLDYFQGKEGFIRLQLPAGVQEGFFVFKASYKDQGLPGQENQNLVGADAVIVRYR